MKRLRIPLLNQISSKEAIERYKKNIAKGKSTSKSKLSAGKEERLKDGSHKKIPADKEKSTEQRRKLSSTDNITAEIERKNENHESQTSTEIKTQVEVN